MTTRQQANLHYLVIINPTKQYEKTSFKKEGESEKFSAMPFTMFENFITFHFLTLYRDDLIWTLQDLYDFKRVY